MIILTQQELPIGDPVVQIDLKVDLIDAGQIGSTFGSQLGQLIGGSNILATIGASTLGAAVGAALFKVGGDLTHSLLGTALPGQAAGQSSIDYAFNSESSHISGDIENEAGSQTATELSSLLFAEAAQALGLKGFSGQLLTQSGVSITNQLYQNIINPSFKNNFGTLTTGIDEASILSSIASAGGSIIGSELGSQIVSPDSIGDSLSASVGSAYGATIGIAIGSEVAGITLAAYGSLAAELAANINGALISAGFDLSAGLSFGTAFGISLSAIILPGIGALIGAALGQVVGAEVFDFLDDLTDGFLSSTFKKIFGEPPTPNYQDNTSYDTVTKQFVIAAYYGYVPSKEDGDYTDAVHQAVDTTPEMIQSIDSMTNAYLSTVNSVLSTIGGTVFAPIPVISTAPVSIPINVIGPIAISVPNPSFGESQADVLPFDRLVGDGATALLQLPRFIVHGNTVYLSFNPTVPDVDLTSVNGDAAQMVRIAVEYELRHITIQGGDLVKNEALQAWQKQVDGTPVTGASLPILLADLQVASDYSNYLQNTDAINTLMAAAPDSAFTIGWIATLLQAEALGLNKDYVVSYAAVHDSTPTPSDDTILTADGNDLVSGDSGNDTISTYGGNDTVYGGPGDDVINLGAGDDQGWGEDGNDTLNGGAGNDTLTGGAGADYIDGGPGTDTASYYASPGAVTIALDGTPGTGADAQGDQLFNIEVLLGSPFDDHLTAGSQGASLYGEDGNDTLTGGAGNDSIYGGAGDDSISGGDGNDTIDGGDGNNTLSGGSGDDTITSGAGANLITGDDGNDYIKSGDGNDTISGGNGNDTILGYGGDDLITGDAGDDSLYGLSGNDTISGGAGNDTIYGDIGQDVLNGNDGNDQVFGGQGDDAIDGGAGNDTLVGGAGNDTIYGGDGNDVIYGNDQPNPNALPATAAQILALIPNNPGYNTFGILYSGPQYTVAGLSAASEQMLIINPAASADTNIPTSEVLWSPSQIAAIQQSGKLVFGYVNLSKINSFSQNWQESWTTSGLGSGGLTAAAPSWLGDAINTTTRDADFTNIDWQHLVEARIGTMIDQGFNGTLLDDVLDYFSRTPSGLTGTALTQAIDQNAIAMRDFVIAICGYADSKIAARDGSVTDANRFQLIVNGAPYILQDALNTSSIPTVVADQSSKQYFSSIDGILVENYFSQGQVADQDYTASLYGGAGVTLLSADTNQVTQEQQVQTFTNAVNKGFLPYATDSTSYDTLNDSFLNVLTTTTPSTDNDMLYGGAGNDQITPGSGNDTIDGGLGDDTVYLSRNRADVSITTDANFQTVVIDKSAVSLGTKILRNVEHIAFNDQTVDLAPVALLGTQAMVTGTSGSALVVTFSTPTLATQAQQSLAAVSAAVTAGTIVANTASGGTLPSLPAGTAGMAEIDTGAFVSLPAGYTTVIDVATGPASVISAAAGDQLVVAGGTGSLLYSAVAGSETIYAGSGGGILFGNSASMNVFAGAGDLTVIGGSGSNTVTGGGGNLLVFDTSRTTINGGTGSETIIGSMVGNTVNGGSGNMLAFGTSTMTYNGGTGAATIIGGLGGTTANMGVGGGEVFGSPGGNNHLSVSAGGGNATLVGAGTGDVVVASNAKSDLLVAGAGAETLNGSGATGNLVLFGGVGPDMVIGGSGNDLLIAESGSATMVGGGGNNNFVFVSTAGSTRVDTIQDFDPTRNAIGLYGYGDAKTVGLAAYAAGRTVNGSTSFTLSDGTTITMNGSPTLHAYNFFNF